jgi:hypothetical protein
MRARSRPDGKTLPTNADSRRISTCVPTQRPSGRNSDDDANRIGHHVRDLKMTGRERLAELQEHAESDQGKRGRFHYTLIGQIPPMSGADPRMC